MLLDFNEPEVPAEIDCDLCIVGAGAAGISMALHFADSGLQVWVLEAGGLEYDDADQDLYDGDRLGQENASPRSCRLRYFGGTTNHWQGWCGELAEEDFETRDWVPHSGWPIGKRDLDPYYARARVLCEVGSTPGEFDSVSHGDLRMPDFDPSRLRARFWSYSPPTRFGLVYRDRLRSASSAHILLHANLVRISTDDLGGRVTGLEIRTRSGRRGRVTARAYVLACGGMENARQLMLTRDVQPQGLGNGSGTLGRFFMQHPERKVAQILSDDPHRLLRAFDRADRFGGTVRAHLTCATSVKRQHRLLNAGFDISAHQDYSPGYLAMRNLRDALAQGEWPADLDSEIWAVLSNLDGIARDIYTRARGTVSAMDLVVHSEQTPNPDSQLTLGQRNDAFGLPVLQVDWRLTETDKRSIIQSTQKVGEELARLGLGRMKLDDWLLEDGNVWPENIWSGCHHLGTTRMADDPAQGIVDRHCRVHGVPNLYLAGSSVFPTGGYVTPTLTIVALALRMADLLEEELLR